MFFSHWHRQISDRLLNHYELLERCWKLFKIVFNFKFLKDNEEIFYIGACSYFCFGNQFGKEFKSGQ